MNTPAYPPIEINAGFGQLRAHTTATWEREAIQVLRLNHNRLTALPCDLSGFTELRELDLSRNPLGCVPPDLNRLEKLTTLRMDQTGLQVIPDWFAPPLIEHLSLAQNQLSVLPSSFFERTPCLQKLVLPVLLWVRA